MSESSVLFCPFCREPFDGLERCPTHELKLLPFSQLHQPSDALHDDDVLPRWSPEFGRGLLLAGALVTLLGFFCPLARLAGQVDITSTMFGMARTRSAWLWLVPNASFAQLLVLYRRNTLSTLRGARLVVLLLAALPSLLVASYLVSIRAAAARMTQVLGSSVIMHIGLGAFVVWLGGAMMLRAGFMLGVRRGYKLPQ